VVIYAINTEGVIAAVLQFDPKAMNTVQIEEAIGKAKSNGQIAG